MIILGIETSCDETAASIASCSPNQKNVKILSSVIASSQKLHAKTGGIIPEIAARAQIKFIIPVIQQALFNAQLLPKIFNLSQAEKKINFFIPKIDAIAVTFGPGLIGSLLVGIETARTLSYLWNKPLIPINHLYGHIYANWIEKKEKFKNHDKETKLAIKEKNISFPAIALIVSGGHTDLVYLKHHGKIKVIGGTRDDAAGEAFDKIGRLLSLPYPAGPTIAKLAEKGDPKAFILPRPMIESEDFDFSFSGLKTAVLNLIKKNKWESSKLSQQLLYNLCASVQQAIIDVLVTKTLKAANAYKVKSILLGGGVSANSKLRVQFIKECKNYQLNLFIPEKEFCTDNAAMIAAAACFNYKPIPWQKVTANPEIYY